MEAGRRIGWGHAVAVLREAAWLGPQRARGWCIVLLVGLLLGAARTLTGEGLLDPFGKPIGTDFSSFWAASRLALEGSPLAAWDVAAHHQAQKALFGAEAGYYAFFYPPPFLLACLPLALLPYGWSLAAWLLLTGAAWWRSLRPILPQRWAMLALLAFPAVFVNATHGQNGFLTAALVGAAALALGPRPWIAGFCIGALVIKPHLGLAIPVALLAARRWTAFAASALGVGLVLALATLAFGTEAWRAFLATAPLARETLERGLVEPQKMVSVFAAIRLLGGGLWLAYGVQAMVAAAVLGALAWLLRRRPGGVAEMAAVAAATPLCSPFLLDYDLMLLGLPLAWVLATALREGRFLPWEKLVLLAAFVLPLVSRTIGATTGVPIAPLVMAALFSVVARRVAAARPDGL